MSDSLNMSRLYEIAAQQNKTYASLYGDRPARRPDGQTEGDRSENDRVYPREEHVAGLTVSRVDAA